MSLLQARIEHAIGKSFLEAHHAFVRGFMGLQIDNNVLVRLAVGVFKVASQS